jgi:hypothetical protein
MWKYELPRTRYKRKLALFVSVSGRHTSRDLKSYLTAGTGAPETAGISSLCECGVVQRQQLIPLSQKSISPKVIALRFLYENKLAVCC